MNSANLGLESTSLSKLTIRPTYLFKITTGDIYNETSWVSEHIGFLLYTSRMGLYGQNYLNDFKKRHFFNKWVVHLTSKYRWLHLNYLSVFCQRWAIICVSIHPLSNDVLSVSKSRRHSISLLGETLAPPLIFAHSTIDSFLCYAGTKLWHLCQR